MPSALLEPLPFSDWEPTKTTFHLWCQIVGKIALGSSPLRNHWWNCTLRPTAHGFKTQLLRSGDTFFDIELDIAEHRAIVRANAAPAPQTFELYDGLSVAGFLAALRAALSRFAIDVPIRTQPYGFPGQSTPFEDDHEHRAYDAAALRRFWNAIAWTTGVFERFATEFAGKQGPVQLFWHGFDLALGRYSGRRADGAPNIDAVQREAYSHEVIAFGFWPGDANVAAPAFYTYTAPEPKDLSTMPLSPAGASWVPSGSGHMGQLPYDVVRTSPDPEATLLAFLRSGYDAGARSAAWDTAALAHAP